MNNKKRILLFYNYKSSFIKKDIELLGNSYQIAGHDFYSAKKWKTPLRWLSQILFLVKHAYRGQLIICQFAGYHSLIPIVAAKILRLPSLVIVGGTDAHFFPALRYGNWQKKFLKTFTAQTFKWCSHIAPKHHTLMQCNYTYDVHQPAQQGIYARMPGLQTPFTEITNGYDGEKWQPAGAKAPNSFLTINLGWEYGFQYQLKGIDLIMAVAPKFPAYSFTILGVPDASILKDVPPNVTLLPPAKHEELPAICSRHQFYLQLSMAEGFPNAICEAMLCGCIPIGSSVFSIPEIIGRNGFLLKHRNTDELQGLIAHAVNITGKEVIAANARQSIINRYSIQKRQQQLLALCKKLLTPSKKHGAH